MTAPRDVPTRWLRIGIPVLLVLIWLVGGSIGGPYFGKVDEVATNDQSSFLPSSAEATQVQERLADFTGGLDSSTDLKALAATAARLTLALDGRLSGCRLRGRSLSGLFGHFVLHILSSCIAHRFRPPSRAPSAIAATRPA